MRAWMNLKLQFRVPPLFTIVFDADAMGAYERLFTTLMKVRLVEHALERLWMVKSRLSQDRAFCQVRHSMHFFISNLLYHLQVRVSSLMTCLLS
jgi:Gamma tubulin complex component C-terminal